ncbi:lymphotoxin-alpha-like [Pecten maximus]|uniref:lymphotoxin-alpha-like n=1 Tax=Pecten maximus TaxID=6579 RepID=UPI001458B437|nr:lymphotoxin-alpha-like [Pecten maximus]
MDISQTQPKTANTYASIAVPISAHTPRSISESSETELIPQVKKGVKSKFCSTYRVILTTVFICVVVCIGLSICVTILFTRVNHLKDNIERLKEPKEVNEKICQRCDELKTGPFDDDNPVLGVLDREGDICCASTPNQIKIILDLMYQRQKTISDNLGDRNINQSKSSQDKPSSGVVSAHLLVGLQQLKATRHGPDSIRNWDRTDRISHLEGLVLNNDKLSIPKKGLYLVYSQICFSIPDTGDFIDRNIPFLYHYVYRYNVVYPNGGNQLLLKSVNSQRLDPSTGFGDLTSYTSAALRLDRGDQLYIRVSNSSFVSRDQKASFFGVVKLDAG